MSRQRMVILILVLAPLFWALRAPISRAEDAPTRGEGRSEATVEEAPTSPDPYALAELIDLLIDERLDRALVDPAPIADDGEFLRRAWLDIAGRIPPASEARAFLEDDDSEKRRKLVDRLLDSPGYVQHMTDTWSKLLIPGVENDQQLAFSAMSFGPWLRKQFVEEAGFDAITRGLLTVPIGEGQQGNIFGRGEIEPSPFAFLAAREGDPGELAAGASRVFMGIRLECAQCHDHPFATWSRDEFWGMAAFFSGVERRSPDMALFQGRQVPERFEITIPESERVAQATFLDGSRPRWRYKDDPREVLADWLTTDENPYFSRALANRVWAQLLGRGLVDPIDEMGPINPPSHPELLDALAEGFARSGFDPKFLIRAIAASDTYQRSSAGYSPGQDDPSLFARMPVRGLSPEQLYESLVQAAGLQGEEPLPPFIIGGNSPRKDLMDRFADDGTMPTDRRSTILQALTMMNGQLVADALSGDRPGTLASVADSYFLSTAEKVEALFFAALGRPPRDDERDRLVPYVDRGGPTLDPKQALADVFWALLNSPEFTFNH